MRTLCRWVKGWGGDGVLGCMGVGGGGMLNGGMYHDCNIFRQVIDHSGPGSAVVSPFRSTKTLQVLRRGENVVRIYWRGASGGAGGEGVVGGGG